METVLTESRFYMWRGIVAMAHADGVVTPHEISFIHEYAKDIPFNAEELETLLNDLQTPQDPYEMFSHMTDIQDKKDFFALARALSWCDGDYAAQEKQIINCLEKLHWNEEEKQLLAESRDSMGELDLDSAQWNHGSSTKDKGIFGFLTKLKASKVDA